MRTLKELRKRITTFTVAKWLVRFYGLSVLPANEVEDVVSDMPDDERFRKFADYVVAVSYTHLTLPTKRIV